MNIQAVRQANLVKSQQFNADVYNDPFLDYLDSLPTVAVTHITGLCNTHVEEYYNTLAIEAEESFQYSRAASLEWMATEESNFRDHYDGHLLEQFGVEDEELPF